MLGPWAKLHSSEAKALSLCALRLLDAGSYKKLTCFLSVFSKCISLRG